MKTQALAHQALSLKQKKQIVPLWHILKKRNGESLRGLIRRSEGFSDNLLRKGDSTEGGEALLTPGDRLHKRGSRIKAGNITSLAWPRKASSPKFDLQGFLERQTQAPAPFPQEHGHDGLSIMERFKRMAPPPFKWESQPLLAKSWMREVEKIFRAIRCAEEDKVSLATYILHILRDKKKTAMYQHPLRTIAALSQSAVAPQPPRFRPSEKECPHCGRTHGSADCWKLAGKCLMCGSTKH
ncbi:hypothetical protein Taro_009561 [Colocasia esculenta]|uniref:Uncharacterized protein n=1 Tax=Colocasia esculenta TaxID=4460 RepID=A0A843U0S8_COLES|nr:hypothetical protein [Colocasia esculenta]